VVVTGGNLRGVEIWQPKLAREVMHTHTISGNIRPTGFPEYTEGSDRDMVLSNQRFQRPVYQYVLSPREPNR